MQRRRGYLGLILVSFFCLAMGGGGDVVATVPQPDREFSVMVVDAADISFQARKVSVDGLTFLPVRLGEARMGVDFARISEVLCHLQGDRVAVTITDRDGQRMPPMFMEPDTEFTGVTEWGNFRLAAENIKEIRFQ
jgi:hypothetical protein